MLKDEANKFCEQMFCLDLYNVKLSILKINEISKFRFLENENSVNPFSGIKMKCDVLAQFTVFTYKKLIKIEKLS